MQFLHNILLKHCQSRANDNAVVTRNMSWTYNDLAIHTRLYTDILHSKGICRGERVIFLLKPRAEYIALSAACSILGITFVPLDQDAPEHRLQKIIQSIEPSAIISDSTAMSEKYPYLIHGYFEDTVLKLHGENLKRKLRPGERNNDQDVAYIIFTSGSTGIPKGICMSHLAVTSFLSGLIDFYEMPENTRYASCSPLNFDYSLLDIGLCLGSGGTLIFPTRALLRAPNKLVQEMVELKVDHFSGVPTLWKQITKYAPESLFSLIKLKRIVFAGESFPTAVINHIRGVIPSIDIINIYGQSESIACTFDYVPNPLHPNTKYLPVGKGHPMLDLFLIDKEGKELKESNTVGELYIGGRLLFQQYWKNPEETSKRLIIDPRNKFNNLVFRSGDMCFFDENGVFYFVGRKDNQINIFGNRIELEEIDSVLASAPNVANVCVVAIGAEDQLALHAAVVTNNKSIVDTELIKTLRKFCAEHLPAYMCPQRFHILTEMPLNSNDKNDRKMVSDILTNVACSE